MSKTGKVAATFTKGNRWKAILLRDALDAGENIPSELRLVGDRVQVVVPERIDSQVLRAAVRNFKEDISGF